MDDGWLPAERPSQESAPRLDWQPDAAWLTTFQTALRDVDIVSFDVFDTALTRLTDSPTDVFAEVERVLLERLGAVARDFALHREESEAEARALAGAAGRQEIELDDIYARLALRHPPLAPLRDEARAAELDAERALCVGVPDIQAACALARAAGKRILFVSDMYLPAGFVRALLTGCGYGEMPVLFISSETGHTKAGGGMWPFVGRAAGAPTRILHVGDDDWADQCQPARHGLRTLPYRRARSARRSGAAPGPALLPFSLAQRDAVLAARRDAAAPAEPAETALHRLGQVLGGIVLGAFLRRLARNIAHCDIDRLYFCARDGWLPYQAWQTSGLGARTGIEASYLRVSRWPLQLARGHVEGGGRRVTPALLRFLVAEERGLTLGVALRRAGLLAARDIVEAAKRVLGPLETTLDTADAFAALRRVIEERPAPVLAMAAREYETLAAYLTQEGIDRARRPAIVDLGWHGTMQAALARVLQAMGRAPTLSGFYYALWPQASGQRPAAGWMDAAFASDFCAPAAARPLQLAADMLEELHGAPEGTVRGYRSHAGSWQAVQAPQPAEAEAHARVVRPFQDGTLAAVRTLFTTGRLGPLAADALTPEAAVAAIRAVLLSPTPEEVGLLGGLVHCRGGGGEDAVAVIVAANAQTPTATLRDELDRRGWPAGLLRAWREASDGPDHAAIATLARALFAGLPERSLRPFLSGHA